MDRRILVAMAVVAAALAAVLVFVLMPSTSVVTASKPMPEVIAAAPAGDGAVAAPGSEAAPPAPPPEPGHRSKIPTSEAETKVDVPEGARIEDGGLAFGDAVCQHVTSCGCQRRTPRACAQAYAFITPESYPKAKCLVDLPCAELCESLENPGKTPSACARGVNDLVSDRFRNRAK